MLAVIERSPRARHIAASPVWCDARMTSSSEPLQGMAIDSSRGERRAADHRVLAFLAGFACAAAIGGVALGVAMWGEPMRGFVWSHTLAEPLVVVGSVLRLRDSLPEGGELFEVVVRVDRPLETMVQDDLTWVVPLQASPLATRLRGVELLGFRRRVNARRQDVDAVLAGLEE